MEQQERARMLDELKKLTQQNNTEQQPQFNIHDNQSVVININKNKQEENITE